MKEENEVSGIVSENGDSQRPKTFTSDAVISERTQRTPRPRFNRVEYVGRNNDHSSGYSPRQHYRSSNSYNGNNDFRSGNRNDYGHRNQYDERGERPRPFGNRYNRNYQADGENRGGYTREYRPNRNYQGGYHRDGDTRQNNGYSMREDQGRNYNNYRPDRDGRNMRPNFSNNRRPYTPRPRQDGYDPNAKYSYKKRIEYAETNIDPTAPVRLNKFLANAGVCSRRDADKYIEAGVVSVNGTIVTELGTKVLRTDEIKFHDQPVKLEKKVYVLLNKPKDYVTTSDDPQKRKTVMELVHGACPERIYPVGRLDRNTTGVLLLTNDGDMAAKLTHPKFLKKKIYHVYLDKNVTAADMQQIVSGITLDDGEIHADALEYASPTDKKQVGIEIHSGKNRIVRRIFESLGYHVTKLDRVYFAGLTKKNLRRGDWRYLTEEEVNMLRMGAFE